MSPMKDTRYEIQEQADLLAHELGYGEVDAAEEIAEDLIHLIKTFLRSEDDAFLASQEIAAILSKSGIDTEDLYQFQ